MDAMVKPIMLSPRTVSRSTGRSAVAAAAYRSGARLANERDGVTHDYRRRAGVVDTYIVAPAGADWAQDRAALWNRAEATEKRKDAKVAREWVIGLPCELDEEARARLVRAFAGVLVERYGVGVDVALHQPSRAGDERNWHAHLLTTTREVTAEGLGGKTRVLDSPKTSGAEVTQLRRTWAEMSNQALERAGIFGVSYTELSHEDRGLDAPTVHLGPSVTAMERRGAKTDRGNENRQSAARNADFRDVREAVEQAEAELAALEQDRERQAEQAREVERQRRADPLAHYRGLVAEAEREGDPLELVQRQGWLRKAAELVAAGERPTLHTDELMKAGEEAMLAWAEQEHQARKERENPVETAWTEAQETVSAAPEAETPEQVKLRRWQAMSVAELKQEIRRLEPLGVSQRPGMAESEQKRLVAEATYKQTQTDLATKQKALKDLVEKGSTWRSEHPIRNWLHQNGLRENHQYRTWQEEAETLMGQIEVSQKTRDTAKTARDEAVRADAELAARYRAEREQEMKEAEPDLKTLAALLDDKQAQERQAERAQTREQGHDRGDEMEMD